MCGSHATIAGIMVTAPLTPYTRPLLDSTFQLSAEARGSDEAIESPSLPRRKVPSYRSSLRPPPHPSITPVSPSGRSWYRVASLEESCKGTWAKALASHSPSGPSPGGPATVGDC